MGEGNGHGKTVISAIEKGPGYVIITVDTLDSVSERSPILISRTIENWLKDNPGVRVRCAAPIVQDGQTIAVHLWFDGVTSRPGQP
jgi:hypothetical protein